MSEWKDLKEQFPTDRTKLFLVRSVRPDLGNFTQYYLCTLGACLWDSDKTMLQGFSQSGRRFSLFAPKEEERGQPIADLTMDLFSTEPKECELQIHWKEIEK